MSQSFLESLAHSRLLSTGELEDLRRKASALGLNALGLANHLGEQGLVTPWQALQLLAGQTSFFLGPYRLLERIGSGSAAVIYKARHVKLGYVAALKVMSAAAPQHPVARARFRREVRAAVAVRHPNVVATYGGRCTGKASYLVMEYVEGEDLDHWLKRYGELPLAWCCEVARQVAVGLEHIHSQGIVHRDIKPNNLLIVARSPREVPQVKVADLGAASIQSGFGEAVTPLTSINQFLGTPNFVAPEQVVSARDVDHRADIFSLGCTLFKILTGQTPFGGATLAEKLLARTKQDAPPVSDLRKDVPPQLGAVIARALARDPDGRFSCARDLVTALRPFSLQPEKSLRTPVVASSASARPAMAASPATDGKPLPPFAAGGPPKPLPWKWFLERQNAQGLKETYLLNAADRLVVGRAADCDIQVRDVQVSRRHCLLIYRDAKWHLHDLCSNNGTIVNGVAIQHAELKHGDQLRFGSTVLTLAAAPQFPAASQAASDSAKLVAIDEEGSHTTGLDQPPAVLQDAETIHFARDHETAGVRLRFNKS
ncbi:MAG TPA: FHA domain-containing serine/threonine-protein kinase [Pirellulales bacterium]|nr:FHA domain-containing serine/threonine-protein kinase [Pirellulales bacterium]